MEGTTISFKCLDFVPSSHTQFMKWCYALFVPWSFFEVTKIKFCIKRASKIIVLPKEKLLLFSTGTFFD